MTKKEKQRKALRRSSFITEKFKGNEYVFFNCFEEVSCGKISR